MLFDLINAGFHEKAIIQLTGLFKLKRAKEISRMIIDKANNYNEKYTWEELLFLLFDIEPRVCPSCGKGRMNLIRVLGSLNRVPP